MMAQATVIKAPPPMAGIELPPELDRVLRDYEAAWKARNPQGLAGLFTADGFVLSNNKPPIRGQASIAAGYVDAGGDLRLRGLSYALADSVAYIVGAFGWGTAEEVPDAGKFVLALRKGGDGRWLIAADIDNSNRR
jgi:ketosteroid isomerase-like protein